jgi:hypothetical protein
MAAITWDTAVSGWTVNHLTWVRRPRSYRASQWRLRPNARQWNVEGIENYRSKAKRLMPNAQML